MVKNRFHYERKHISAQLHIYLRFGCFEILLLTRVFCPHLQKRIRPLNIDIGPLSPLGSHILIRTTPNMTLTLLIIGK